MGALTPGSNASPGSAAEGPAGRVGEGPAGCPGESPGACAGESLSSCAGESLGACAGESPGAVPGEAPPALPGDAQTVGAGVLSSACPGEAADPIAGGLRALCRLEALPDGTSKGFPPAAGGFAGLFAVRRKDAVHVYVNSCPHLGVPLDWMPDRFLSADGDRIVCATHGAEFRIADGMCVHGPCYGAALEPVLIQIKDGTVFVSETAGY